jgi:hypothetical protein
MNFIRLCAVALLLTVICVVERTGQEKRDAILIDEFGRIECEDLSGRLDTFLSELASQPGATGYVVVSSNAAVEPRTFWYERFIDGYALFRRFDQRRFLLVSSDLPVSTYVQLWLVPAGVQIPVAIDDDARYISKPSVKRLRFYSNFGDEGPCYTGPPFRLLSKYLKANPEMDANIALGAMSLKVFQNSKTAIIRSFRDDYSVNTSRLRFFWVRTRYDSDSSELWLIRRKRR